jgi:Mrp family chromosome partitioning ATPase
MIFLNGAGPTGNTFLFTSAVESEGKTTMALQLAAMLGTKGKRVLVADAHWQRPMLGHMLDVADRPGLTDLLQTGGRHEDVVVQDARLPRVSVLPRGTKNLDLVQQGFEERMRALLDRARMGFDYVLLDGAPATSGPEVLLLNPMVDGVLLIVACGRTQQSQIAAAQRAVEHSAGKLTGVILNRVPRYLPDYYRTV